MDGWVGGRMDRMDGWRMEDGWMDGWRADEGRESDGCMDASHNNKIEAKNTILKSKVEQ